MKIINEYVSQLIDYLAVVNDQTDHYSQLEKDVILQLLREYYLLIVNSKEEEMALENEERRTENEDAPQIIEEEPIIEEVLVIEEEECPVIEAEELPTQSLDTQYTILNTPKEEKRSLNDLLVSQKEDWASKFQQSKIEDLTKAISLNDKFTFIKELFQNRGDDFSQAIHILNNCSSMEQAFGEIEKMKLIYDWDTTLPAYSSLCELVRRKYLTH